MPDSRFLGPSPNDLYPQRADAPDITFLDRLAARVSTFLFTRRYGGAARLKAVIPMINHAALNFDTLTVREIRQAAREVGLLLRREPGRDEHIARAFALIRRASELTVGMRHFDVQLLGGWILFSGLVAEMQTGEGKTLTAVLPASAAALSGQAVHVITVNDYLVLRDSELMRPVYESLGLSVAAVTEEMTHEERQIAYRADIVYCSNKTVVFDYLRDRIVLGTHVTNLQLNVEQLSGRRSRTHQLLLRGLQYAIVDEADSVLVDEARTPLIISADAGGIDVEVMRQALKLAGEMEEGEHFRVLKADKRILLTESGRTFLIDACEGLGGVWEIALHREELVLRALTAIHLYLLDEHYLVRDGKIQVVDEFTGRVMEDRSWSQGLHQLIELKENLEVTAIRETLAKISYQRFFRRYLRLSGMTGTAAEVRGELATVYGLGVVSVPTNRPSRRKTLTDKIFNSDDEKWDFLAGHIDALHRAGAAVLVGTRSVAASERASERLKSLGIEHMVLNAKEDEREAQIIAQAGLPGRITIATNMAGRGTDIALDPAVEDVGGLHVILTERHEAGRIDRQLAGRCARQGDPGVFLAAVSMEDALLLPLKGTLRERIAKQLMAMGDEFGQRVARRYLRYAQHQVEREQSRIRRALLQSDRTQATQLSFSGRPE